jgi:peptidoglycan DL-endopeptidase CwlO
VCRRPFIGFSCSSKDGAARRPVRAKTDHRCPRLESEVTKLSVSNRNAMAACLVLVLALGTCTPALADPIADKKAQAAAVQQQVDSLNAKAEVASEQYNAAQVRYIQITSKVHATEDQIAQLQKRTSSLQRHLDTRAGDMYREGPLGFLSVLLSVRTFDQLDSTIRVLTSLNQRDAATISKLKETKAEAQMAHDALAAEQTEAGSQEVVMAGNAKDVKAQLAARTKLLAGITTEIRTLIATQLAQQRAQEQARALALLKKQQAENAGTGSGGYAGINLGGNPPTNSKGAAAVYWAEKQLGKPYVWAAAGPDSFDCSGLTMYAYGKVGVHLNHYSGDQFNEGSHVSKSNLQPGDLVFFGSPIHHMGMYVGGGDFIEAPHTGANVRIARLDNRSDYAGATRPY